MRRSGYLPNLQFQGAPNSFYITLPADAKLFVNGAVFSHDCKSRLVLQEDRNLVAYDSSNRVLWASNTQGDMRINHLLFQSHGIILLRDEEDNVIWWTGDHDYVKVPYQLKLEDNGSLRVVDKDGGLLWSKPSETDTWQAKTTEYTKTWTATRTTAP